MPRSSTLAPRNRIIVQVRLSVCQLLLNLHQRKCAVQLPSSLVAFHSWTRRACFIYIARSWVTIFIFFLCFLLLKYPPYKYEIAHLRWLYAVQITSFARQEVTMSAHSYFVWRLWNSISRGTNSSSSSCSFSCVFHTIKDSFNGIFPFAAYALCILRIWELLWCVCSFFIAACTLQCGWVLQNGQ